LELLKVKNKNENAYKDLIDSMRREDGEYEGALEIAREQIMEEITAMNNVKAAMARFMERDGKFFKGESIKAKKYVESYDQIQIEKKASLKELWQEVLDRRYANPDPNEEVDEDEEAISEKELEKQRKKFVVDGVFYEFFMKKVTAAVAISS
jgi:hypothetical protein